MGRGWPKAGTSWGSKRAWGAQGAWGTHRTWWSQGSRGAHTSKAARGSSLLPGNCWGTRLHLRSQGASVGRGRKVETATDRELCHLSSVHCELLLSTEDRKPWSSLMTIDPVLDGDPAPLVVVPLPHQGRVAGATGACSARLVRSSTTKGRSQLQQEREVGKRPRSLDGHPVRACVQRVIRWTLCAADEADNSGRVVAPHAVFHIEGHILLSITGYHSIMSGHVAGC